MKQRETFQTLIAGNKRNSAILMASMCALLVLMGAAIGGAAGDIRAGLVIAGVTAILVLLFAWFAGAGTLLALSGAHELRKSDDPQLFNVVEEMAIAGGLPMPKIYLIDSDSPNAFATGIDPKHASVAITRGLREKLNREELQGVMAHELGHVRNFDIRYTLLMAILAGAIVILADAFLRSFFYSSGSRRRSSSSNDRGDGKAQLVLLVVGLVLAIFAPLLTAFIKMALSRQREYLADATAVELTRNPAGLASALGKLTADRTPMEVSQAVAPLYIVNPKLELRSGGSNLLATHPPLEERIARLRRLAGG